MSAPTHSCTGATPPWRNPILIVPRQPTSFGYIFKFHLFPSPRWESLLFWLLFCLLQYWFFYLVSSSPDWRRGILAILRKQDHLARSRHLMNIRWSFAYISKQGARNAGASECPITPVSEQSCQGARNTGRGLESPRVAYVRAQLPAHCCLWGLGPSEARAVDFPGNLEI